MAAVLHDPLRNTLDSLHLDPASGADRPYLISMLRRLGYSETEIQEIIRDYEPVATGGASARDIELEYSGGLRDYLRVIPPAEGFDLNRPGELVDFSPAGQYELLQDDMLEFIPWEEDVMEFGAAGFDAAPSEGQEVTAEEEPASFQESAGTAETTEQDAWETVEDSAAWDAGTATAPDAWEPVTETTTTTVTKTTETTEGGVGDDGAFHYGEWTLYRREVDRQAGGAAPVYFFAKDQPKAGSPATKPEGYEVGVNDRTGLPFLRRSKDPMTTSFDLNPDDLPQAGGRSVESGTRRRVRVLRVRASSREEAERQLASKERQVLGSVPIDVEERWGEQ